MDRAPGNLPGMIFFIDFQIKIDKNKQIILSAVRGWLRLRNSSRRFIARWVEKSLEIEAIKGFGEHGIQHS